MARIDSKVLFLTTSPRTPAKMIPEIALLDANFRGREWNSDTQLAFMEILREENFFQGSAVNDPTFSARDRINRAPQMLGFVRLKPVIELTPAGAALVAGRRTEEVFLRQLLKFQIPSPYHSPTSKAATFCIRPYLEIFRLIRHFGSLRFDELKMFALQMTDYHDFDTIVGRIERFRVDRANHRGSYRTFEGEYFERELRRIYGEEISSGNVEVRESNEVSESRFLQTKGRNMRDYADACIRYLRSTGMINISQAGRSVSIVREKEDEVDFFLEHTDREPKFVDNMEGYIRYLGDATTPVLLTDDVRRLREKIRAEFPAEKIDAELGLDTLKDVYEGLLERRKQGELERQVCEIKDYGAYDDIQEKYREIQEGTVYDAPLMLEWNTWRAMTMLDGGDVKANLSFDDFGRPLSTAQGNMADIVCDYGDFILSVEVTMAGGQRQYETEGEPVARHLGKLRQGTGKAAYCLFIAPTINEASIAHFFMLHRTNISYYGGRSVIVPLPLNVFQKMLEDSRKAGYVPQAEQVREVFDYSKRVAASAGDENEWYGKMIEKAETWLSR